MHALRRTLCATAAAIALGSAWTIATAAERVTLVQRSGEKITGDFDGVNNNLVYVRVSRDEQPKVPLDRIALMQFGSDTIDTPAGEVNDAKGDAHLLVQRDGASIKGHFVTISGSLEPGNQPDVVFKTESGEEKRLPLNQVRRIYLGHFEAKDSTSTSTSTPGSSAPLGAGERVVSVPANAEWVDTGIAVRQGDKVTIAASGEVTLSADPNDKAKPGGSVTQRRAANAPVPDTPAGALIARIGRNPRAAAGPAFAIADRTQVDIPSTGRLFLGVNDDHVGDNSGQFEVRIRVERVGPSDQ